MRWPQRRLCFPLALVYCRVDPSPRPQPTLPAPHPAHHPNPIYSSQQASASAGSTSRGPQSGPGLRTVPIATGAMARPQLRHRAPSCRPLASCGPLRSQPARARKSPPPPPRAGDTHARAASTVGMTDVPARRAASPRMPPFARSSARAPRPHAISRQPHVWTMWWSFQVAVWDASHAMLLRTACSVGCVD